MSMMSYIVCRKLYNNINMYLYILKDIHYSIIVQNAQKY